jgi:hypothetical protein
MRCGGLPPSVVDKRREEEEVPRYLVERTFIEGLGIPTTDDGARACLSVIENNTEKGVTWLHSYVTEDRRKTFCVYDGPSPEAIRQTASRNGLPVDSITPIRVLDPYFYYYAA